VKDWTADRGGPSYQAVADNLYGAVRFMELLLEWSRPHRRDAVVDGALRHGLSCDEGWSEQERYQRCPECHAAMSFIRRLERCARDAGGADPDEIDRIRRLAMEKMPPLNLTAVEDLLQLRHANATTPAEDPAPR